MPLATPASAPVERRAEGSGRYRLIREIGRGGMGVVYAAHDEVLDRPVALKRLVAGALAARSDLERFEREARAAARVQHPGLVRVHDLDLEDDEPFFTMDLIRGRSLRGHMRPGEPWEAPRAARLVVAVARALAAAHQEGLVHRDVKPENILIRDEDGAPLLTDFGVARLGGSDGPELTQTGEMIGTPAYMPPEQALGQRDRIGPGVDIYALGAVLYELLAGRRAYEGGSVAVISGLLTGPPPSLRAVRSDAPLALSAICERAMARGPEARYASANDLADDLERYLAGRPVRALEHQWRLSVVEALRGRERWIFAGLGALALGGLVLAGAGWFRAHTAAEREASADQRLAAMEARIPGLLADGRDAEAAALLSAFASLPENRGTSALSRAWLGEARRQLAREAPEAAMSAFASAFTTAEREEDQNDALLELARAFATYGRWAALSASVERLRARGLPPERLTDLEVSLALGQRDIASALEAWTVDPKRAATPGRSLRMRGVLAQLAGATALPMLLERVSNLPEGVAAPGAALLAHDVDHNQLIISDLTLNILKQYPLEEEISKGMGELRTYVFPGQPIRMIAGINPWRDQPQRAELWTLDGDELHVELRWPELRVLSTLVFQAPWGVELLAGEGPYTRALRWLRRGADGSWATPPVDHSVQVASSDVQQLLQADMDGDGAPELVVALGAWGAMDLRVLKPGATAEEPLTLIGRSRIGVLAAATVLHPAAGPDEIVAWRIPSPNNAQVFGGATDAPPEDALFRFVLRDGKLERRAQTIVGPVATGSMRRFFPADLDGDGEVELVCDNEASATVVLRRAGEDLWEALVLPGITPDAALNADADPGPELLVRVDGSPVSWVLGLGDGALPRATTATLPTLQHADAPLSDDALSAGRDRALQVAALGLDRDAATYLDSLAPVAAVEQDRGALQLVAAELWEAAGDPLRAIDAYTSAGDVPSLASPALEGLERVLEAEHRFAEAVEANLRLTVEGDAAARAKAEARAARLDALSGVDTLIIDLRVGLPDGLVVEDPFAVRAVPGRGLAVRVPVWEESAARLPLRCDGPRVGIQADFRVTNTEWASGLTLGLAPAGQGVENGQLSFSIAAGGGDGANIRHAGCNWVTWRSGQAWIRDPLVRWSDVDALSFEMDVTDDRRAGLCRGGERGAPLSGGVMADLSPFPTGDVDLVIGGTPWQVAVEAQIAELELEQLEIRGCTPRPSASLTPAQRAARALAAGDAQSALAGYWAVPGDAGTLGQIAALMALGRADDAAEVSTRLGIEDRERVWLLRQGPTFAGALLRRWGPRALPLLADATAAISGQLPIEPSTLALMKTASLEGVRPDQIGPNGLDVLRQLTASRGTAALRAGDLDRAQADLTRALSLPTPAGDPSNLRARLHTALVALLLRQGDLSGALAEARLAVQESGAPEITRDHLANLAEVRPLLTEPAWRAVLGR